MSFRHVAAHYLRKLTRQYPLLGRVSITLTAVVLIWLRAIQWGERSTFAEHVSACKWGAWETWDSHAVPHHLVLIADPQLVDPHTYPGRPWPLSTLTELYTDSYMTRNYRLINAQLDPDTIIFLGDLFDGGREWATEIAKPVSRRGGNRPSHRPAIDGETSIQEQEKHEEENAQPAAGGGSHDKSAFSSPETRDIAPLDEKLFVHGENGRWTKWGHQQWLTDFDRFGKIFFAQDQVYPRRDRETIASVMTPTTGVNIYNGAPDAEWQEYATTGGKQRRLITTLPGNHDVGFGVGVQMPVRDRFQALFGKSNRIDVIGNHTFVSLDTPSLSSAGQFIPGSGETNPDQVLANEFIWKEGMDFLDDLRTPVAKAISKALGLQKDKGFRHDVTHPRDLGRQPSLTELAEEALMQKPQLPNVLLTHVPLWRDPDTDCGPLREKGRAVSVAAGYQYQNVLTRGLSDLIVKKVSAAGPVVQAFSGDDHDYCDVTHRYNVGLWNGDSSHSGDRLARLTNVKEITAKSFSWAMGVRKPGFQLVSLWNPVNEMGEGLQPASQTLQTHLCLLPDQLAIFIKYALLLGATLVVLLVRAIVLGLRQPNTSEPYDVAESPTLPRYEAKEASGLGNGHDTSNKIRRHRASSTSLSTAKPNHLSVQRSQAARTRSISPAVPLYGVPTLPMSRPNAPLIERAGYYPDLKWADPDDSDEESNLGFDDDSQAKWKRQSSPQIGLVRRVLRTFVLSLMWVGVPAGSWYVYLIRTG